MTDEMTRVQYLLEAMRTARADWDTLLAQIPEARMTDPGVAGEWSVKDVIAHVTWGEVEVIGILQARMLVGSDFWQLSQDDRNEAVFEENRHRTLDDVQGESRHAFQQLLQAVETLSDEDLTDPRRFVRMPTTWEPWRLIAGNSYVHYREHAPDIRAWLDRLKVL